MSKTRVCGLRGSRTRHLSAMREAADNAIAPIYDLLFSLI